MLAASIFGIPRIVHEQNVVPGRANQFLFRFADKIAVSFNETLKYAGTDKTRCVFTGNPIRASLLKDDKPGNIKKPIVFNEAELSAIRMRIAKEAKSIKDENTVKKI